MQQPEPRVIPRGNSKFDETADIRTYAPLFCSGYSVAPTHPIEQVTDESKRPSRRRSGLRSTGSPSLVIQSPEPEISPIRLPEPTESGPKQPNDARIQFITSIDSFRDNQVDIDPGPTKKIGILRPPSDRSIRKLEMEKIETSEDPVGPWVSEEDDPKVNNRKLKAISSPKSRLLYLSEALSSITITPQAHRRTTTRRCISAQSRPKTATKRASRHNKPVSARPSRAQSKKDISKIP